MLGDTLLIVFISILTALLGEGLTWLLVYRTERYQKLKAEVERQTKKLEKQTVGEALEKSQKKKLGRQEDKLKNDSRDLSFVKMKSMFAIGFVFTALLSMFNSMYPAIVSNDNRVLFREFQLAAGCPPFSTVNSSFDGRVVAKLPFVPISWLRGLSHRNLIGDDPTDCSFIFLYILCTMFVRQNVQKLLGFAPSREASKQGVSIFTPPQLGAGR